MSLSFLGQTHKMQQEPTLARAIMAPRDLALNVPQLQRLSLLFEVVGLVHLDSRELTEEQLLRLEGELEFLAANHIVHRIAGRDPLPFMLSAGIFSPAAAIASRIRHRHEVLLPDPHGLFHDNNGIFWRPGQAEAAVEQLCMTQLFEEAPIVAYGRASRAFALGASDAVSTQPLLELIVSKFPVPPEDIPWQDFLQFRDDAEHKALRVRFRLWLQERAKSVGNPALIIEELEAILEDYRKYMRIQHMKFGEGVVSTLLASTKDALEEFGNLRFGSAVRSILDFRHKHLARSEAELLAPGREISYMVRAQKWLHEGG